MRRFRKALFIGGLIMVVAVDVFVAATVSYGTNVDRKYMAGATVKDKEGNIIGCSCPVRLGDCLCIINTPQPNDPGI